MAKREASLKSNFFAALRKRCPSFYVLRHATRAAPDWSITGAGRTTFWEFKHGTPDFDSPGDQELMCMRLAVAGYSRYVIWSESVRGVGQRTLIVHPRAVHERREKAMIAEAWCVGFDHNFVVDFVLKTHVT